MDVSAVSAPLRKIPRLGEKSLVRMQRCARVTLAGQPEIRPGYSFPEVATEIYFDIEDDPTQDVTYPFGLWIRRAGGEGVTKSVDVMPSSGRSRNVMAFRMAARTLSAC